ncbi:MAG: carboxypeptidase M32 [Ruminococcaceae bacterium]|nr:carboxypeptidase M32 [Oscillospiraceae bacterium]
MKFQNVKEALEALKALEEKQWALSHAMNMIVYDAATAAPKNSAEGRGKTLGILSAYMYELIAAPENTEMLAYLRAHEAELSEEEKRRVALTEKNCQQISRIPQEEYTEYEMLLNDAQAVWEKAKNENDFPAFAPYLEKIVAFNRKFAGYYNPALPAYDALLNEYEEGMTMAVLDVFFEKLRTAIVPLLEKIRNAKPLNDDFLRRFYPAEKQKQCAEYLMEVLQIDRGYCGLAESEHPFTDNFNNKDVRITTHFYENNLTSALYSVIHEGGHAIYELACDDRYNQTAIAGGVSMGIHESQSRFFENIIGRSEAFIHAVYPKIKEFFPEQLADVTERDFYEAVNRAEPSLIRTEADELTYCLHIMIRYELEKQLIAGELSVSELPEKWNRLYLEYLGVEVPNDTMGCLQDTHWSGGSFGYFPSYALGSAYGAQMLHFMKKDLPNMEEKILSGDLSDIKRWLGEHIHRHASLYQPSVLFEKACGPFDPSYYVEYLTEKFTKLYKL